MTTGQTLLIATLLAPPTLQAQQVRAGKRAPDFALAAVGTANSKLRLADFRGHPVVVSFWATWCPPCRKEMPELAMEYQANRTSGLVVLAVNEEALETDRQGRPVYRKKAAHDSSAGKLLLPAIFFVDTAGVVQVMFDGMVPTDSLAKGLKAILTTQHED
jgi:thiol-disulfide isomerase/thioredoxin